MADIMKLTSVDAEADNDYRAERGEPLHGTTVADIMPGKLAHIEADPGRYGPLRDSMAQHGQTAPIAVRSGYLVNGGHRVAMARSMGWQGMHTTPELEHSMDRAWDRANPRSSGGF